MSDTQMTSARLAECRDLLRYESSIAFYSHRAKESMLLLVAEAEDAARLRTRITELVEQRDSALVDLATAPDVDVLTRERDALRKRVAELEGAGHLTVADVVAFLVKKAREYGSSNRENRAKADAVGTMASKISRGAIRPTEAGAS